MSCLSKTASSDFEAELPPLEILDFPRRRYSVHLVIWSSESANVAQLTIRELVHALRTFCPRIGVITSVTATKQAGPGG